MKLTKLGIYTIDTYFDDYKTAAKLLVDTGSASTILNWKGINDLSLSRLNNNEIIKPINNNNPIGAMGADNVAIQLTHKLTINKYISVCNIDGIEKKKYVIINLHNKNKNNNNNEIINIDIGELPILNILQNDNVGGILERERESELIFIMICVFLF